MLTRIFLLCLFVLLFTGCSSEQNNKIIMYLNSEIGVEPRDYKVLPKDYFEVKRQNKIYVVDSKTWTIKTTEDTNSRFVLITIDDAPDQYALEMASILKKLEVPAIFFVNGHFLNTDKEKTILKQLDAMGFIIGNHTNTHSNLSNLSPKDQKDEILSVNKKISEIIGKKAYFYRAPFGVNTDVSKSVIRSEGMLMMNWTYGYDWEPEYQNKDKLAEIMLHSPYLHNGAILLLHDRKWTYEALEKIIGGLREEGYTFVDPSQIKGHP